MPTTVHPDILNGQPANDVHESRLDPLAELLRGGLPAMLTIQTFVGPLRANLRNSVFIPRPNIALTAPADTDASRFASEANALRDAIQAALDETRTTFSSKIESTAFHFEFFQRANAPLRADLRVTVILSEGCGIHFPRQSCDALEAALARAALGMVIDAPYGASEDQCHALAQAASTSLLESIELAQTLSLGGTATPGFSGADFDGLRGLDTQDATQPRARPTSASRRL